MMTYESQGYGFDSHWVLRVCSRKANNEAQQRAYNPKGRDTLAVMYKMNEVVNDSANRRGEEEEVGRCRACTCWECSGSRINEWGEDCDCSYVGPNHTLDDKCIYSSDGIFGLVLKRPEEILHLGLSVPGDIFMKHVLPVMVAYFDEEE